MRALALCFASAMGLRTIFGGSGMHWLNFVHALLLFLFTYKCWMNCDRMVNTWQKNLKCKLLFPERMHHLNCFWLSDTNVQLTHLDGLTDGELFHCGNRSLHFGSSYKGPFLLGLYSYFWLEVLCISVGRHIETYLCLFIPAHLWVCLGPKNKTEKDYVLCHFSGPQHKRLEVVWCKQAP